MKDAKLIKEWEKILAEEGLGINRGRDPRLIYLGSSYIIERIDGERVMQKKHLGGGNRHQPEGHGPDE